MKIAVLADIHSNYVALEECLSYAFSHHADTFFFLGDYVGELAYPQRTMEILYGLQSKYKCYFIRGNKEEYWLNYRKNGEKGWKDKDSTSGMLLYAYNRLTPKDLDFYEKMPIAMEVNVQGLPPVTICHGSPEKVNEKLLPGNERTEAVMDNANTDVIICGHTHIQGKILRNGRCVLNPGSVGVSFLSGGKAQFMFLCEEEGRWQEEFVSLDYDREKVLCQMQEERLYEHAPCWARITERIIRGEAVTHGRVLNKAMALCLEDTGECSWPNIPEKYFEEALQSFGIEVGGKGL